MKKILLSCNTPGMLSGAKEILDVTAAFEVTLNEKGFDEGIAMADKEQYDLFVVNISDLPESSYFNLLKFQTDHPGTAILAAGATLEYTYFVDAYLGSGVNQLEKPFVPDTVVPEVCRALQMENADILKLTAKARTGGKSSVLVVDDSAMILRSVKAMLEDEYHVSVATSGKAALKILHEKRRPDIVLLDYEMPEMNGMEMLWAIRNDVGLSKLKVIFLTGITGKDQVAAVMQLKPEGYILKPVTKEKLKAAIKAALEGKNVNQTL